MTRKAKGVTERLRYGYPHKIRGLLWTSYDALAAIVIGAVKLASPFHRKLGASVRGRREGITRWKIAPFDERPSILLHAASRGEFESLLPLIDRLTQAGTCRLAVSFSSPSVEKSVLGHAGLWAGGYLPFDDFGEQIRFLSRLEPSVILVAKHDIWPNMIRAAATIGIPFIIINGNFHSRTRRRLPLVKQFNRQFFAHVAGVWTVSEDDSARVKPLLQKGADLAAVGDTRYDRTIARAIQGRERFADLKKALGKGPVIIAGSSWPPEEKIVLPAFASLQKKYTDARLVIAPHEPDKKTLIRICEKMKEFGLKVKLHSQWNGEPVTEEVYYVDKMGVLADIYAVGWAAVIGGGFGAGVHSVLEPAAYGLPVAFGPKHHVSHEAGLLLKSGGGSLLTDAESLAALWNNWLEFPSRYKTASDGALSVVEENSGATDRVLERLKKYIGQL